MPAAEDTEESHELNPKVYMGVPKIKGPILGGSYHMDFSILVSILGWVHLYRELPQPKTQI